MSATTRAANRALAAAMRAKGLHPQGDLWVQTKALVAEGLSPKAAARLVRASLPPHEQDEAIKRAIAATPKREVQEPLPLDVASKAQRPVQRKHTTVEVAPVTHAPKRTPQRAQEVKAGKVMRDAKGRLLSREAQAEIEGVLALLNA